MDDRGCRVIRRIVQSRILTDGIPLFGHERVLKHAGTVRDNEPIDVFAAVGIGQRETVRRVTRELGVRQKVERVGIAELLGKHCGGLRQPPVRSWRSVQPPQNGNDVPSSSSVQSL